MKKIYFFDEGKGISRKLLGGKGHGLCEMTRLHLPVPPGFVITTNVCKEYYTNNRKLPKDLTVQIKKNISKIEKLTGKQWGHGSNPLLVSVRSGAAISMPGMMDTILNLGLNDTSVNNLAKKTNNARFAWDSYRRFIQLFGKVVFSVKDEHFDKILNAAKRSQSVASDGDLNVKSLKNVVSSYKKICKKYSGVAFPMDPYKQLDLAVKAVFSSWMGERAIVYRTKNNITLDIADGTAVNVVAMVFGNMGPTSSTGVVFTRNPADGSNKLFGEYLVNAQGEDVVAGVRTPKPIHKMKSEMPSLYKKLTTLCSRLEKHYREPQDVEFTIEDGNFYLLQTRSAKMNALGMIKTSTDMVKEGLIDKKQSILRLNAEQIEQLLHRTLDSTDAKKHVQITRGIAASPGAATGKVVFDVKRAMTLGDSGTSVILVRQETKPEDVPAFFSSVGILTSQGGKTSHAAVVARGMGKSCIVGCSNLQIDYASKKFRVGKIIISEGDVITIDGSSGIVYKGAVDTVEPKMTKDFTTILNWARNYKRLGVRANADTPLAASTAKKYGAEGIGLCRTERMFNAKDRIGLFVDMIMAKTDSERKIILDKLGRLQKSDFIKIFTTMAGHKVTIRLLDPPLHEFLPNPEDLANRVRLLKKKRSSKLKKTEEMLARARDLSEINPMMGHRGVRVGITYPEIYTMQIKAVLDAAAYLNKRKINAKPQIMVPQVSSFEELQSIKDIFNELKADIEKRQKIKLAINFGTMLEVVRACLISSDLVTISEFFSFGTNDLTQAVFSFSREDVEAKFIPEYIEKNLLETNPFQSIDTHGMGSLMSLGVAGGRKIKPTLEVGLCGEHGGDPKSIEFCHNLKISYVSASPHRIPIAIIAAAQSALLNNKRR